MGLRSGVVEWAALLRIGPLCKGLVLGSEVGFDLASGLCSSIVEGIKISPCPELGLGQTT